MKLDPWEKAMVEVPLQAEQAWRLALWDWVLILCCTVAFLYWLFYS